MTGRTRSRELPSPSWPKRFAPQHATAPPFNSAHVCSSPALTATALPARPCTSVGAERSFVDPSPSWPNPLLPQHSTLPFRSRTQVCCWPMLTAEAIGSRPTRTGTELGAEWPGKEWLRPVAPQHSTPPPWVTAHVCPTPAATLTAFRARAASFRTVPESDRWRASCAYRSISETEARDAVGLVGVTLGTTSHSPINARTATARLLDAFLGTRTLTVVSSVG